MFVGAVGGYFDESGWGLGLSILCNPWVQNDGVCFFAGVWGFWRRLKGKVSLWDMLAGAICYEKICWENSNGIGSHQFIFLHPSISTRPSLGKSSTVDVDCSPQRNDLAPKYGNGRLFKTNVRQASSIGNMFPIPPHQVGVPMHPIRGRLLAACFPTPAPLTPSPRLSPHPIGPPPENMIS